MHSRKAPPPPPLLQPQNTTTTGLVLAWPTATSAIGLPGLAGSWADIHAMIQPNANDLDVSRLALRSCFARGSAGLATADTATVAAAHLLLPCSVLLSARGGTYDYAVMPRLQLTPC
jgi:hypothetical protein